MSNKYKHGITINNAKQCMMSSAEMKIVIMVHDSTFSPCSALQHICYIFVTYRHIQGVGPHSAQSLFFLKLY